MAGMEVNEVEDASWEEEEDEEEEEDASMSSRMLLEGSAARAVCSTTRGVPGRQACMKA